MARNINGMTATNLFANPVPTPTKEDEKKKFDELDGLAVEIGKCAEAAKREKELRPQLLGIMQELGLIDHTTPDGVVVKVVTTNKDSFDELAAIEWAKTHGRTDLVKTIVTEAIDMEKLERLVYEESGKDETPYTNMVQGFTTTTQSTSLRVTLPKAKGGKK